MARQRELIKHCTVEPYDFDIKVTRDMVYKAFKRHEALWEVIQNSQSTAEMANGRLGDLDSTMELLKANDVLEDEKPEFVADIFGEMVKEAKRADLKALDCTPEEFLGYCDECGVLELVEDTIFDFAMQGFIGGKGVTANKKPLVTVKFV